ncbi:unnamed protein product [Amoebophrya sp. A25]|nr:unnamed protein product [Amoebophrya sp. A25]|eukprot:GSA25T00011064001.1
MVDHERVEFLLQHRDFLVVTEPEADELERKKVDSPVRELEQDIDSTARTHVVRLLPGFLSCCASAAGDKNARLLAGSLVRRLFPVFEKTKNKKDECFVVPSSEGASRMFLSCAKLFTATQADSGEGAINGNMQIYDYNSRPRAGVRDPEEETFWNFALAAARLCNADEHLEMSLKRSSSSVAITTSQSKIFGNSIIAACALLASGRCREAGRERELLLDLVENGDRALAAPKHDLRMEMELNQNNSSRMALVPEGDESGKILMALAKAEVFRPAFLRSCIHRFGEERDHQSARSMLEVDHDHSKLLQTLTWACHRCGDTVGLRELYSAFFSHFRQRRTQEQDFASSASLRVAFAYVCASLMPPLVILRSLLSASAHSQISVDKENKEMKQMLEVVEFALTGVGVSTRNCATSETSLQQEVGETCRAIGLACNFEHVSMSPFIVDIRIISPQEQGQEVHSKNPAKIGTSASRNCLSCRL